jgi:CcmD family protein
MNEETMYDFLSQNQLYIVLIVTMLTWAGILGYLFRLDKKIRILEKQIEKD